MQCDSASALCLDRRQKIAFMMHSESHDATDPSQFMECSTSFNSRTASKSQIFSKEHMWNKKRIVLLGSRHGSPTHTRVGPSDDRSTHSDPACSTSQTSILSPTEKLPEQSPLLRTASGPGTVALEAHMEQRVKAEEEQSSQMDLRSNTYNCPRVRPQSVDFHRNSMSPLGGGAHPRSNPCIPLDTQLTIAGRHQRQLSMQVQIKTQQQQQQLNMQLQQQQQQKSQPQVQQKEGGSRLSQLQRGVPIRLRSASMSDSSHIMSQLSLSPEGSSSRSEPNSLYSSPLNSQSLRALSDLHSASSSPSPSSSPLAGSSPSRGGAFYPSSLSSYAVTAPMTAAGGGTAAIPPSSSSPSSSPLRRSTSNCSASAQLLLQRRAMLGSSRGNHGHQHGNNQHQHARSPLAPLTSSMDITTNYSNNYSSSSTATSSTAAVGVGGYVKSRTTMGFSRRGESMGGASLGESGDWAAFQSPQRMPRTPDGRLGSSSGSSSRSSSRSSSKSMNQRQQMVDTRHQGVSIFTAPAHHRASSVSCLVDRRNRSVSVSGNTSSDGSFSSGATGVGAADGIGSNVRNLTLTSSARPSTSSSTSTVTGSCGPFLSPAPSSRLSLLRQGEHGGVFPPSSSLSTPHIPLVAAPAFPHSKSLSERGATAHGSPCRMRAGGRAGMGLSSSDTNDSGQSTYAPTLYERRSVRQLRHSNDRIRRSSSTSLARSESNDDRRGKSLNERGTRARALSPARDGGSRTLDQHQRMSVAMAGGGGGGEGVGLVYQSGNGTSGGGWEGREIAASKSLSFKKVLHLPSPALEEAALVVSSPKKLSLSPHRPRLADMRRMLLQPEAGGLVEPHLQAHKLPRQQQQFSPQRLRLGDGMQNGVGGGGRGGSAGGLVYQQQQQEQQQQQRQQVSPQRFRQVNSQQQSQGLGLQNQQQAVSPQRMRPAAVQHQLSPQCFKQGGSNTILQEQEQQQRQLQMLPGGVVGQQSLQASPRGARQVGIQQQQCYQQQPQQQQERRFLKVRPLELYEEGQQQEQEQLQQEEEEQQGQEPTTPGRSLVHNMDTLPRDRDKSPTRRVLALRSTDKQGSGSAGAGASSAAGAGAGLSVSSPRLKLAEVKRRFLVHDVPALSQDEAVASLPSDLVTTMLIHQHLDDDDDDDDDNATVGPPPASPPHLPSPRIPKMHVQPLGFSAAVDIPLINPPETRKLIHDMRSITREEASALF